MRKITEKATTAVRVLIITILFSFGFILLAGEPVDDSELWFIHFLWSKAVAGLLLWACYGYGKYVYRKDRNIRNYIDREEEKATR